MCLNLNFNSKLKTYLIIPLICSEFGLFIFEILSLKEQQLFKGLAIFGTLVCKNILQFSAFCRPSKSILINCAITLPIKKIMQKYIFGFNILFAYEVQFNKDLRVLLNTKPNFVHIQLISQQKQGIFIENLLNSLQETELGFISKNLYTLGLSNAIDLPINFLFTNLKPELGLSSEKKNEDQLRVNLSSNEKILI
ncbi:hypothetical protein BpHYR1_046967 [Brachionus plicatilis]|uniref:Transmembrane protein n=1 Tax=Brachionus plicatilis TaxID=10195 RepID=A0A3M7SDA7_BRAPC|nr:hypothetical protein BpHYR1_046967 [Brachionus plicatilis]